METTLRSRLIPVGLIGLALLPSFFGVVRLLGLARGVELMPGQARFAAAPVPIVLHIVGATSFCIVGALQFGRRRTFHRRLGWILAPAGLVAALSGVWMTLFYPLGESDGSFLRSVRLLAGVSMAASIVISVRAIVRRDVGAHGRWMVRAYALGIAAGTQALILVPATLFGLASESERSYALLMAAGWFISVVVAEYAIRSAAAPRALPVRLSPRELV